MEFHSTTTAQPSTKQIKIQTRILAYITVIGIATTVLQIYLSGGNILELSNSVTVDWLIAFGVASLVNLVCSIIRLNSDRKIFQVLPYTMYAIPLMNLLVALFYKSFVLDGRVMNQFIDAVLTIPEFLEYLAILYVVKKFKEHLIKGYFNISLGPSQNDNNNSATAGQSQKTESNRSLGSENTILDRVIRSILNRAETSSKAISYSLIIMVVIVIVGGSFSVGTVLFNEVKRVHELEEERNKMLEIVNAFKTTDSSLLAYRMLDVQTRIIRDYGDDKTYTSLIKEIDSQTVVSWQDIAMRVTIAALTLFLVQIFFHIYKYNQQQTSQLLTKAEVLELFKDTAQSDQEKLRTELLLKLDAPPRFDKSPTTPIEQILSVLNKANDAKK